MTGESLADSTEASLSTSPGLPREIQDGPLPATSLVTICDRVLGEVGRRKHLFAWLRSPGSAPQDWLAVDAYYPANRLVVICGDRDSEHAAAVAELVRAHGLRLLRITSADLGAAHAEAHAVVRRLIEEAGPIPPRIAAPRDARAPDARAPRDARAGDARHDGAVAWMASSFTPLSSPRALRPALRGQSRTAAAERAIRLVAARKLAARVAGSPASARIRRPIRPPGQRARARPTARPRVASAQLAAGADAEAVGLVVGLALVAVVVSELYLAVAAVTLAHGSVVLSFGLAIDACSRVLGTVAAGRALRQGWAWVCAFGGSPFVAIFSLSQRDEAVWVEPAPLAGLVALMAMAVIAIAVVGSGLSAR